MDVLDPSVMSAAGTHEPGGTGWYELLGLLHEVAQSKHVVGFDLVELCSDAGLLSCSCLASNEPISLSAMYFYKKHVIKNG